MRWMDFGLSPRHLGGWSKRQPSAPVLGRIQGRKNMEERQQKLAFGVGDWPSDAGRPKKRSPRPGRKQRVIQDLLLEEGFWAVTRADQHSTLESLQQDILMNLKQQSKETRSRYACSITRWFFPDQDLASPAALVWNAYRDKGLTLEVLRVMYLKVEPIVAKCVEDFLYPIHENATVPASYFDTYLLGALEDIPAKTRGRLKQNLRKLGFLTRSSPGKDILRPLNPSSTGVFLLFTLYFAREAVRTVEMPTVLTDPFWKYLGLKSEDAVRRVFRDAANTGLLAKYVIADQLELLTTFLTFRQCLERKVRL